MKRPDPIRPDQIRARFTILRSMWRDDESAIDGCVRAFRSAGVTAEQVRALVSGGAQ